MLRISLVICLFLVALSGKSQSVEWLVSAGGDKSDKGSTIVVDQDGYIYETGYYNEEADFGPYNTAFSFPSSKEVYVAKMDPDGNYLWVRNGLNYFDDRGLGLCVDEDGFVYVTGTCWGGLEWGSLSVYNNTSYTDQIFIVKIDPLGNEVWMKNAGINEASYPYNDDHGQDLAADGNGNIYVTGFMSNNDDFSVLDAHFDAITVPMQPNDSLAFVAKLDTDGNWAWVETFDGIYASRDNACAVDDEGNVYITGSFTDDALFGTTTLSSYGKQDIYVVKYNPDGVFQWVRQAGSTKSDRGNGIIYGHDGHMYVTGEFRDVCSFKSGLYLDNYGGPKGRDIFVAKISKDGEWIWASKGGSKKGSDKGIEITANSQGNIFVTGQFSANADFGAYEVDSDGDSVDVFIAAIDTLGEWRWVMKAGGSDFDRGAGIVVDSTCNLYVTGYYASDLAIGGESLSANLGGKDIFTLKMSDVCFGYEPPEDTTITVEEPPVVEAPDSCLFISANVITANNDQVNDKVSFFQYCGFPVQILIVNRWGQKVFESTNPLEEWKGHDMGGQLLEEGVYFWSVHYEDEEGNMQQQHGHITLFH